MDKSLVLSLSSSLSLPNDTHWSQAAKKVSALHPALTQHPSCIPFFVVCFQCSIIYLIIPCEQYTHTHTHENKRLKTSITDNIHTFKQKPYLLLNLPKPPSLISLTLIFPLNQPFKQLQILQKHVSILYNNVSHILYILVSVCSRASLKLAFAQTEDIFKFKMPINVIHHFRCMHL